MKAFKTVAVLASLAISSLAFADDAEGLAGAIAELEVNTTSADTYLQYHGRLVIVNGKNLANKTEYRWGGTSCGTRVLTDAQVSLLQRALENGSQVLPRYQVGQGSAQCLVGFKFAP